MFFDVVESASLLSRPVPHGWGCWKAKSSIGLEGRSEGEEELADVSLLTGDVISVLETDILPLGAAYIFVERMSDFRYLLRRLGKRDPAGISDAKLGRLHNQTKSTDISITAC